MIGSDTDFWGRKCAAIVPCRNESASIADVVLRTRKFLARVLVIDDGSHDASNQIAKDAGASVVRHEISRGKGASLRTGWQRAREESFEWGLFLDGDGQHAPEDIPKFLAVAEQGNASLIVGNRMRPGIRMPWVRRLVNSWMSRRLSRLTGYDLPDTQCGFRMVNLPMIEKLSLTADHYEAESELIVAVAAAGRGIDFVPVQVIYGGQRSGIQPVRDTIRWFKWLRQAEETGESSHRA